MGDFIKVAIETKIGATVLTITNSNHIHATPDDTWAINKVAYSGGMHLGIYDGKWRRLKREQNRGFDSSEKILVDDYNALHLYRGGGDWSKGVSAAARAKALEVLEAAVNDWATGAETVIKQAEYVARRDAYVAAVDACKDAKAKLAEAETAVLVARDAMEAAKVRE